MSATMGKAGYSGLNIETRARRVSREMGGVGGGERTEAGGHVYIAMSACICRQRRANKGASKAHCARDTDERRACSLQSRGVPVICIYLAEVRALCSLGFLLCQLGGPPAEMHS